MAVRKSTKKADKPDETSVAAFISGGGSSPRSDANGSEKVRPKLTLERGLLEQVDAACKPPHRKPGVSRNHWIVEAIIEKLEREGLA